MTSFMGWGTGRSGGAGRHAAEIALGHLDLDQGVAPRRRRLLRSGAGCPVSSEQGPTGRGPRTVARRRIFRSRTAWPVALAPSRGAAARPAPSKLQSRNRERPRGSSVIALARVAQPRHIPPGISSQRQTRMVSERPGSCTVPCVGRGHCPRHQAPA